MLAHNEGIDLYYTIEGTGTPMMFMHGGMGLDHSYFRPWLDPLADRMQLIYFDHRGNGQSTRLTDFTGIDHRTWADDADKLRKQLGHDKIVLLGHSCGGGRGHGICAQIWGAYCRIDPLLHYSCHGL